MTNAPGLVGALLVGVSYAKALAFAPARRVLGVHHMEGHLFATSLEHPDAVPPFTALLVSGGHTLLARRPRRGVTYRLFGATRDDAAGEAFDKVAKLLGLPYPGGRHVEQLARDGRPRIRVSVSRGRCCRRGQQPGDADYYDVSFSGLKTAVLHAVRAAQDLSADAAHIARAFQDALIDTLVAKTMRAASACSRRASCSAVAWPATARSSTRCERAGAFGATVFAPSPRLATDNAAMIARAGLFHLERGERVGLRPERVRVARRFPDSSISRAQHDSAAHPRV